MADKSAIEWTDATWNPIVGCSIHSPGCANCYAMKMAARLERMFAGTTGAQHYRGLTQPSKAGPVFTGKVAQAPEHILTQPLRWRRGRKIFVNSMGDLFHESIPDEWIIRVLAVMACTPQHTYQVLTKRADRMRELMAKMPDDLSTHVLLLARRDENGYPITGECKWPLPNVWLGVSTERQQEADERIPLLLQTPAAVRFISAEPLLGPVNLMASDDWLLGGSNAGTALDWVIVGGESGDDARPMHPDWARSLRDQCDVAGTKFFFKQWGEWQPTLDRNNAQATVLDAAWMRVGKKAAGRLLDGREHNGFPRVAA